MDSVRRSLTNGVISLIVIYAIAIPFYVHFEGWDVLDSAYFVTVSITSAGYGDLTPKTSIGRGFTMVLLLTGVSLFFYYVTHIGQFKEKTIDPLLQKRLNLIRSLTEASSPKLPKKEEKQLKEKIKEV